MGAQPVRSIKMGTLEELSLEVRKSFFPTQVDQQVYLDVIASTAATENERSTAAIQLVLDHAVEGKKHLGQLFLSLSLKTQFEARTLEERELYQECKAIMNVVAGLEVPICPMSVPFLCSLMEHESGEAFNKMEDLHGILATTSNTAKFLFTKWNELCPERSLKFDMRPKAKLDPAYAMIVTEPVIARQITLFTNIIGLTMQIANVDNEINHYCHAKKIVELIVTKSNSLLEDMPASRKLDVLCKRIDKVGSMYLHIMKEICEDASLADVIQVYCISERENFSSCRTVDNGTFFKLFNEHNNLPKLPSQFDNHKYSLVPSSAWRYSMATRLYELSLKTELIMLKIFEIEADLERKLSFVIEVAKELESDHEKLLQQEYIDACEQLLKVISPE